MSTSHIIPTHTTNPHPHSPPPSTTSLPPFHVRLFERSDLPLCRALLVTTSREFVSDPKLANDESYLTSFLKSDMADIHLHYLTPPRSTFVVAHTPSGILGMAGLRPMSIADPGYYAQCQTGELRTPFKDPAAVLELNRMAVAPEARRRGVASALNEACVTFARGCGAEGIHLVTAIGIGNARNLYLRLGYAEYRVDRFDAWEWEGKKRAAGGELSDSERPKRNVAPEEVPSFEAMADQRARGIWHVAHFFISIPV